MFDQLNHHEYLQLLEIGETDDWKFRLVIAEAGVSESLGSPTVEEESNDAVSELLKDTKPIEVTDTSKRYEIIFNDYITYSVSNESYSTGGEDEVFEGKYARVYTKSVFLEYVANSTFATEDFPGPFKHYGFCCLDHIVDVASMEAPVVSILNA